MVLPEDEREVPEHDESEDVEQLADQDSLPLEAEPADVLEQVKAVPTDDEDYR